MKGDLHFVQGARTVIAFVVVAVIVLVLLALVLYVAIPMFVWSVQHAAQFWGLAP